MENELTFDFTDSSTQAGLAFVILNAQGEELFLGEIHSLMEWVMDPDQDELAEKIDDEFWSPDRIDVVRLAIQFDGNTISMLSSEETRQFLLQLDLVASLQCYQQEQEEEAREDAKSVPEEEWN